MKYKLDHCSSFLLKQESIASGMNLFIKTNRVTRNHPVNEMVKKELKTSQQKKDIIQEQYPFETKAADCNSQKS